MEGNPKMLGKGRSYSIVSSRSIWMLFVLSDMLSSGEAISTVHIMRSTSLVRRRTMEKSDFTLWNVRGSMVESETGGTISGVRKIQIREKSTHGGIL